MTWSVKLRNGDIALGGAQFATVTGEEKLVQDLRAHLLERMGTDNMHPEYGSLIDGGTLPDGTVSSGYIGDLNSVEAQTEIEADIRRIVSEYQARQLVRAKEDRYTYGKVTLSRGEVLLQLNQIMLVPSLDSLNITLELTTANETTVELAFDLTAT